MDGPGTCLRRLGTGTSAAACNLNLLNVHGVMATTADSDLTNSNLANLTILTNVACIHLGMLRAW